MRNSLLFLVCFCMFFLLPNGIVLAHNDDHAIAIDDSHEFIVPPRISFDVKLANSSGPLQGKHFVTIRIGSESDIDENYDMSPFRWIRSYSNVLFENGVANFILGDDANPILPGDLSDPDTVIQIEVNQLTAAFPLPSVPYSIYSQSSLYAEEILAENIIGDFVTTMNVRNDLIVSSNNGLALYVDNANQRMGVGKMPEDYSLDIDGKINASGYFIDGQSIESIFSWEKKNGNLYYNNGSVGIGTSEPEFDLHVSGNISAHEYYIYEGNEFKSLFDVLSAQGLNWKTDHNQGSSLGIYYAVGNVGIGTSENVVESLVVSGAIKLSESVQTDPVRKGTIEYKENDFYGYIDDGVPFSLTGIRIDPNSSAINSGDIPAGSIPYFVSDHFLDVTKNFRVVTRNNFFGIAIGTDNTRAALTVVGDGQSPYFEILSSTNDPVFVVDRNGRIGIGTTNVLENVSLKINGILDASDYLKNGGSLSNSLSENSFWNIGTTHYGESNLVATDLFYSAGYVGIGTDSPKNMLELSSRTDEVALTFDINDTDLFTIGITSENASTFIISQGSNLDVPIFSFSTSNIGIGLDEPKVSLHVSGNAGFLVEGIRDLTYDLRESLGSDPVTGSAMFYYPVRSVFRAGYASDLEWDVNHLGAYSAAFGYNNTASGLASFVGGGYENIASGDYSVVPGGKKNIATGDYSFAGGYYASASHDGSFVWADTTSSTNRFESSQKNQFLIRAYGGVGINTNQTGDAALVIQNEGSGDILKLLGTAETNESVAVSSKGQFVIGNAPISGAHEDMKLAVSGRVGVGSTDPDALLHIQNTNDAQAYLMYVRGSSSTSPSSNVFVITNTGNVGIGTAFPTAKLAVSGNVKADSFLMVDPDDPSAVIKLQPSNGSPFTMYTGEGRSDAYRLEGFIGLGTMIPNSLLELSNQNTVGAMPIITFDYLDQDVVQMGLITSNEGVGFAIASEMNFTSKNAAFVVTDNVIIIGRGLVPANPDFSMDVSGNVNIDGKLAIATDSVHAVYDVFVGGSLAVATLNVAGVDFSFPEDSPWKTNGTHLYVSDNYKVAIGTDNATEALVVSGSVRVSNLIISANQFKLDGSLSVDSVNFQDQSITTQSAKLLVDSGELVFQKWDGSTKALSSPLQAVDALGDLSGPLAFWVDDTTISKAPFYWDGIQKQLEITSNIYIRTVEVQENGLEVSSNVSFLDTIGLSIDTTLDHKGASSSSSDYSMYKLDLDIEEDWGKQGGVTVRGLDLTIKNDDGTLILNQASVVGVYVDVTSVNVQDDQTGNAYAAKFLGGNVGIGVEDPSVALEVNGVISANYFNLSSGVSIDELTINEAAKALVVKKYGLVPRVGIGTLDPTVSLDVVGRVSANFLSVSGLELVTMNIGPGAFSINSSGNIGIGTDTPSSSFHIVRTLSDSSNPYIAEKISLEIDGTTLVGQSYVFEQNLTGLSLDLDTLDNSSVRDKSVKGIDIDLVSVNLQGTAKAYGLYVDVGVPASADEKRYAAIFKGGHVGIGTSNPTEALTVSGAIKADNLYLSEAVIINNAITVNNLLTVESAATFNNVTVNTIYVSDSFHADTISFSNADINVNHATFDTVTANNIIGVVSAEIDYVSANNIEVDTAIFSNGLTVATTNFQPNMLFVDGSIRAQSAVFSSAVEVPTFSVDNGGTFYVGDNKVGIGTNRPESRLHVVIDDANGFSQGDTDTWNAFRLGADAISDGQTIGLLFSPEDQVSSNIGSGILAQRREFGESNLLFLTDPVAGSPKVRMIISSEGTVGIGNIGDPETFSSVDSNGDPHQLHVKGTAKFEGAVAVDRLEVADIYGESGSLVISANQGIGFNGNVIFNREVVLEKGLVFTDSIVEKIDPNLVAASAGYLYVYEDDLYFVNNTTSKNLSAAYTGKPGKIPVYDSNGALSDGFPLSFDNNMLSIGTVNAFTQFKIESVITPNTSEAVQEIILTFNRRTGTNTKFIGLNIQMDGVSASGSTLEGRLGDNETAIGVHVDLSDLQGSSANYNKYAAIFNGGNVGIGTTAPLALLHVQAVNSNDLFRVDGDAGYSSFMVSSTGNVGIGTIQPDALVEIQKPDANFSDDLFKIVSSNNLALVRVSSNGDVVIRGDVSANLGVFNTVSANGLSIAGGMFFVSSNGDIAIGTDNVDQGSVTIYKTIDSTMALPYIGEKLDVIIDFEGDGSSAGSGNFDSNYTYNADLTGFDIMIQSEANNLFGSSASSVATGVSINMSNLMLGNNATVYGLYVDVGDEGAGEGSRYAAYFNGNVGVGTITPTYSLTVSGNVYSTGLIVEGNVSANRLTVNRVVINNTLTVSGGDVTINGRLTAETVTVNKLVVNDSVQAGEGIYDSVTVNERLWVPDTGTVIVGTDTDSIASDYIMHVSGNVTVNGMLEVDTLAVSIISANSTTINIRGHVSANQLISAEAISLNMLQFTNTYDNSSSIPAKSVYVKDDNLYFKGSSSGDADVDLTSFLTSGIVNRIPVYEDATLTSNAYALSFDNSSLILGDDGSQGSYHNLGLTIHGQVNNSNAYIGHLVGVTLNGVSAGQNYTGIKINFESQNFGSPNQNTWGRLLEGDTAIGLHVDMSQSLGDYQGFGNSIATPKKYAALFNGGLVGIGTADPTAALHVKQYENSEGIKKDIFRVDVLGITNPAFLVDEEGRVGINTSKDLAAQLVIESTDIGPFVVSNNSRVMFSVTTNAVGINTHGNANNAFLSVSGNVLFSDIFGIPAFYVGGNKTAIGHISPVALLDIKQPGSGDDHLFKLSSSDQDHFLVDRRGDFYFGNFDDTTLPINGLYDVNVINPTQSIVLVTNHDNPFFGSTSLPPILSSSAPYGFMSVVQNQSMLFMGHVTQNESLILFGAGSNPTLNIVASTNSTTTNVIVMTGFGVGVLRAPSTNVALSVSKNFLVGTDTLFVTKNYVGIGSTQEDANVSLNVQGSLKVKELEVTDGGIKISTLNVTGQFDLQDTINHNSSSYTSALVSINLKTDMNKSLYGLKIEMNSLETGPNDEDPKYLMAGNADAYGVYVDMSDLAVAGVGSGTYTERYFGNKYAAVFKGGNVGIGTKEPRYPLEVQGQANSVIAGFGSVGGGMVIRDWGLGKVGLNVINDSVNSNLEHIGITIKASATQGNAFVPALVGIGTTDPDKALVVNGDMRLGIKSNNPIEGSYGRYGSKLFFSGGPSWGLDSDNGDDLFMSRFNLSEKVSELRVNFSTVNSDPDDEAGVAAGRDAFIVGYTKGTYHPVLKVHNHSKVTIWGDTQNLTAGLTYIPEATLHVRGSGSTNDSVFSPYTTVLERTGGEDSGVLALTYDTDHVLGENSKFIGFYSASTLVGSIEGNGNGGIRYVTSGADYAEYLAKKDTNESFEKGDIVSVVNGVITKDTSDFQQLMVLSSAAAVAGNWPQGSKDDFELVAFYGQVPTKVRGKVSNGDFILAGFGNDGVGIAKSYDSLTIQDRGRIVGRAWESSRERGVKLINTAVGFAFGHYSLNDEMDQLDSLNQTLDTIRSEREALLTNYQVTLEKQAQHIDRLLLKLENAR